jgi:hypothetical protein
MSESRRQLPLGVTSILSVSLQWLLQLAPSLATLGAAAIGLNRGEGKLRRNLHSDAVLAKDLPDNFAAKEILMSHIEAEIKRLHDRETVGRRDWTGTTLGVIFALAGGYGTLWFFKHPEWWRWFGLATAVAAALGLYGIVEGLTIKKRDSKGRTIEEPTE